MKIALFSIQYYEKYKDTYQLVIDKLEKAKCEIWVNELFYKLIINKVKFLNEPTVYNSAKEVKRKIDMFFTLGGDGTILDSIPIIRNSNIPILGINMGRLGFLSSVSHKEIDTAINDVLNNNYILDKRALLSLKTDNNLFGEMNFALNEFSIHKRDHLSMIVVHVYIDDKFLNSYWADGLLISTPTGSTAYALAVGGPIVTPGSKNFIISPIAPHNLTVRPVVIPDNSVIKLKIQGRSKSFLVGLDSRFETINSSIELVVSKSNFSVSMIQIGNRSFFDTIREKLNWGLDIRN
ncbi:MAG: NAD kinase [Bacteroidetes bacterium]|nr:MAG: NAD kinase [Bacteroidota bacterium]